MSFTLEQHIERWKDCTDCPLCQQRDRICLGRGSVPADVLFIGEAPGASEDATGLVFDGPAGKLLDNQEENRPGIIQKALPSRLEYSDVWRTKVWVTEISYALTNLVCCFPREAKERGDNEPEKEEIEACHGRLVEFVTICQPKLIVLVGQLATESISGASIRLDGRPGQPEWIPEGRFLEFAEIVHPAAILRMPQAQKQMAAQRAVVTLRCAVEDMLERDQRHNPYKRGVEDASEQYATFWDPNKPLTGDDIPF